MNTLRLPSRHAPMTLAALALAAAACVSDNTPAAPNAPQFSASFVGYSNPGTKQTMCGNCHVLHQASWVKTGHASAWDTLQASGSADSTCNKCHTTNGATNVGADTGGYFSAAANAKPFFQDVQCESCHGPGQAHVTVPDSTQPIPYFTSGDSGLTRGCGACHQGAAQNFYGDWSHGAHVVLEAPAISAGGACLQCHEGRTVATRFGASSFYVEATSSTAMPISCASCHDPHGSANTHELYFSITVRDSTNLCIQCHKRNAVPDTANTRGPHSPQGPTFLGYSGWQPPGFVWDSTNIPTHSNTTANPMLCVTCHLARFSVGNGASFARYNYTGHQFYAIPCLAADGTVDTTTSTCDVSVRTFAACATSGCHASQGAAQALFASTFADLTYLANLIWDDVNGNGKIDAGDTGFLTQVPATEFKRDSIITVAEGALFNVQLLGSDRSHGVHNPPYLRALLAATASAVQTRYSLSLAPAVQARLAAIRAR